MDARIDETGGLVPAGCGAGETVGESRDGHDYEYRMLLPHLLKDRFESESEFKEWPKRTRYSV